MDSCQPCHDPLSIPSEVLSEGCAAGLSNQHEGAPPAVLEQAQCPGRGRKPPGQQNPGSRTGAAQAPGTAQDRVFPCPLLLSRMQTWPDGFRCCIMKLHEQAHTHSHTEKKKKKKKAKNTPQLYFQLKRK